MLPGFYSQKRRMGFASLSRASMTVASSSIILYDTIETWEDSLNLRCSFCLHRCESMPAVWNMGTSQEGCEPHRRMHRVRPLIKIGLSQAMRRRQLRYPTRPGGAVPDAKWMKVDVRDQSGWNDKNALGFESNLGCLMV